MKKLLLIAILFLMFSVTSFSQNNIQLNIIHKLGDDYLALNTATNNNLDNDFNVTRLQYYISEISIIHDGGIETTFDDLFVLTKVPAATQVDLGDNDINAVEMIKLHIGVEPDFNHLDPGSYAFEHPLAPKNPSMHWGWAPGYRFVAMEGYGGSNFDQLFELHGLGDDNYFTTEIPFSVEAINNEVIINVDADYTRALEDINVDAGVIVHGDDLQAKQCLENFRDYVFSQGSPATTATIDFSEVSQFDVFPNPANGSATITLSATKDLNYDISVTDILGKKVQLFNQVNSNSSLDLIIDEAGFYFINLIKEGQPVITEKLISK